MTDEASEPALDALAAHAARKAERQAALIEALTAGPIEATSARERLEQLLDRETLAELDERVLALVTSENEASPEPTFLEAVATAREEQRRSLLNALLGRSAPPAVTGTSLDGGVRTTPARPETHAELLARVLRDRSHDVGANL